MATVNVVLTQSNSNKPIPRGSVRASEAITSSGSSQQSTGVAQGGEIWSITVSGGNVWVRMGSNPTAAAGDDWLLVDGTTRDFEASANEKVAVIDAA